MILGVLSSDFIQNSVYTFDRGSFRGDLFVSLLSTVPLCGVQA